MITLHISSADDTRGVARAFAPLLRAGDIVSLAGEMGAGKTYFVQEVARSLGVTEPVTSPTFNLVHTYDGAKFPDRKSTRLNSSHSQQSRMPSSA